MKPQDYRQNIIFIQRTIKAFNAYEDYVKDKEDDYSHTLFINACVGLLMVPEDSILGDITQKLIDKEIWGIAPEEIIEIKGDKGVRNVVDRLRDAIAHNNFRFDYDLKKSIPIKAIHLRNRRGEFTATFDFENFKKFVLKVADEAVKCMHEKIDK